MDFPQGIWGVSIGSILATALAYRIPPREIQKLFQEVSLDDIAPSIRLTQLWEAPRMKGL
jgi:patatin-like phospholipase/acyl hydrolase